MAGGAYRTDADLVLEALANLGVLASGQSVDPEDYAYVQTKLDAIRRKLAALEIVNVPDITNIPGEYFADLADIVAGECATKFGATDEDVAKLIDRGLGGRNTPVGGGAAAQSLKQMTRGKPTFEPLRTFYI